MNLIYISLAVLGIGTLLISISFLFERMEQAYFKIENKIEVVESMIKTLQKQENK